MRLNPCLYNHLQKHSIKIAFIYDCLFHLGVVYLSIYVKLRLVLQGIVGIAKQISDGNQVDIEIY